MGRGIGLHRRSLAPNGIIGGAFRALSTNNGTGLTYSCAVPVSVQTGDILIYAAVASNSTGVGAFTPSGWTYNGDSVSGGPTGDFITFNRTATVTDPGQTYSANWTSSVTTWVTMIAAYGPVGAFGVANAQSNSTTTATAGGVTTGFANSSVLYLYNYISTIALPSSAVSRGSVSAGSANLALCDVLQTVAGAAATKTATVSPAGWIGDCLYINPVGH